MGTGSFSGVKRPGRGVDHPLPSSAEVKERVELYLYSPFWDFVACYRLNFIFQIQQHKHYVVDIFMGKSSIFPHTNSFLLSSPCRWRTLAEICGRV